MQSEHLVSNYYFWENFSAQFKQCYGYQVECDTMLVIILAVQNTAYYSMKIFLKLHF